MTSKHDLILIVGAGGVGCEVLKNLALSSFKRFDIIDVDTIEYSNLSRQCLYGPNDCGKFKAEVAARKLQNLSSDCTIRSFAQNMQNLDSKFFMPYAAIICCIDNIAGRRWLNSMIYSIYHESNVKIPMIDAGTEGFKGHARTILPMEGPCVECLLDLFPSHEDTLPLCSITNLPQNQEHCVQWALSQYDNRIKEDEQAILDSQKKIEWIHAKALERAKQAKLYPFEIEDTKRIVQHIVPTIISTNAIIASVCIIMLENLFNKSLINNHRYFFYNGESGAYSNMIEFEKDLNCSVCGFISIRLLFSSTSTLSDLVKYLKDFQNVKYPSIHINGKLLYFGWPPNLEFATRQNLNLNITSLCNDYTADVTVFDRENEERGGHLRLELKLDLNRVCPKIIDNS